ncbi:MAG: hypothetical protein UX35_C0003G0110 [Microgenomates group bacterium GW2011_GWA1_46_15]|nr:MAG: hypothetical protein UX35_C0003G0110 [Microgenomates group bacterium GW2011_GWA1_46_15]
MNNPKNQTTDTIVESLLSNTSRQYTESACGGSSGAGGYTDYCCDTVIEV